MVDSAQNPVENVAQAPVSQQAPNPEPVLPSEPPTVSLKKSQKPLFIVIGVVLLVLAVFGAFYYYINGNVSQKTKEKMASPSNVIHIGLSLDTLQEARWIKDRDLMTQKAQSLGASVVTLVANSDDNTQIAQIQNLISQKVNVIIIVAHNSKALSGVIAQAHKAGIKVIAYDRLILNSDLDLYISFDSVKVGQYSAEYVMAAVSKTVAVPNVVFIGGSSTDNNAILVRNGAMGVLDPMIKEGRAKLVFDKFTPDWSPEIAYKNLKAYLDAGGKVDAVVASNDGTAGGAILALKEHNLSGKVPVSGQDAELAAVKRLTEGTQTITLYKPITLLANKAIESAINMANGKTPETNSVMNNNKLDVPSFLINPIPVTKATIKDTLVKDGFYSTKDIYGF